VRTEVEFDFDEEIRRSLGELDAEDTAYRIDSFVTSEVAYNEAVARCRPVVTDDTGAYLGVGPCQTFTYVGALDLRFAVVVDARVDNLVAHLLFKLVIERCPGPLEYLAFLFSRELPPADEPRPVGNPEDLVRQLKAAEVSSARLAANLAWLKAEVARRWLGSNAVLGRIERIYSEFFQRQLAITSVPESYLPHMDQRIPRFEQVLLARTSQGLSFHFLADQARYEHVRRLQQRDAIVPIVGNILWPQTVEHVNRLLRGAGRRLSVVYLSNLEEFLLDRYVVADGRVVARPNPGGLVEGERRDVYDRLVRTLRDLDSAPNSVLVRFFFPGEHAGRRYGADRWLHPSVVGLPEFVSRYEREPPASVLETY
jgi:hypothetical protein